MNMRNWIAFVFMLLLLFTASTSVYSQSEKTLYKKAQKFFDEGNFDAAAPLYAKLVDRHNQNHEFNYKYGVCLLKQNNPEQSPVAFLEFASNSPLVNNDVFYYMGKAFQKSNQFQKAINSYTVYKKIGNKATIEKLKLNEDIESCLKSMNNMAMDESSKIQDKKEVVSKEVGAVFSRATEEGNFADIPERYLSTHDNPDDKDNQAFLSWSEKYMFFASYGKKTQGSKDIFMVKKSITGEWADPVRLPDFINSINDEGYPTFIETENVLYFSSNNPSGMGGYDIYKSIYDPKNQTWTEPEILSEPYNSAYDDYYFVMASKGGAFFASNRESRSGYSTLYHTKSDEVSGGAIFVNGHIITPDDHNDKSATITVTSLKTKEKISTLESKENTGSYEYVLPGPGQYRVTVRKEGYNPVGQTITFNENSPKKVRQELLLRREVDDTESLAVTNHFPTAQHGITGKNTTAITKDAVKQKEYVPKPKATSPNKPKPVSKYATLVGQLKSDDLPAELRGAVYKVQIGAFRSQPVEKVYENLANKGLEPISHETSKSGWLLFFSGESDKYSEIMSECLRLRDIGYKDAYPVAIINGRKIDLERR
ncbi:MAG: hypothetical protein HKO56_05950 [Bacteroidia bacterium]|nr:hypothetical protein [Bacteroidia bacterium]